MFRKAMRTVPFVLGCFYATALVDCMPAPSQDAPLGGRAQGVSATERLTKAEWAAYIADQQYVHGLVKPDVRVQLNYADPRQFNFAMARLKLAGKDAKNSPHLFELIEARRQKHIASGLRAGALADPNPVASAAGRTEMHFIETSSLGNAPSAAKAEASALNNTAVGTASSTFPGGAAYTYVDVSISTVAGLPIAPLAYQEEFDNPDGNIGADVTITTSGDASVTNIKRYRFDSYKYEDHVDGGFTDDYIYSEAGNLNPQSASPPPVLAPPTIQAPIDTFPQPVRDHIISVCMDRAWTNDCDYILHGGAQSIKMPLQGSVKVTSAHKFDKARIDALRADLNGGQLPFNAGSLKLVLANVGGGCDVTDGNTLNGSMKQFWNNAWVSADGKEFFWNLTGVNAAFFDEGCRQVQNKVKLTARIPLPLLSVPGNEASLVPITISTEQDARPQAKLDPITVTNSCLAEGTKIQLSSGAFAPVESLHAGQSVFNPYARAGHALTITDTAKGSELAPMVRIRDEAGHSLLMTEMHPIATADRGMVQARALQTGDVVMTEKGPSKLVEVAREPYGGKVYNLKVGSDAEMASLGKDQTIVYANGFVVGDGQIQSKYEALALKRGDKPAVEQVAAQWRRDYQLSPRRK